jgi:hypothetical protein
MKNEDKVVVFEVSMGIETVKRRLKRAGIYDAALGAYNGTNEEKVAMFHKIAALF